MSHIRSSTSSKQSRSNPLSALSLYALEVFCGYWLVSWLSTNGITIPEEIASLGMTTCYVVFACLFVFVVLQADIELQEYVLSSRRFYVTPLAERISLRSLILVSFLQPVDDRPPAPHH